MNVYFIKTNILINILRLKYKYDKGFTPKNPKTRCNVKFLIKKIKIDKEAFSPKIYH